MKPQYHDPEPGLPGSLTRRAQQSDQAHINSFLEELARRTKGQTSAPSLVKELEKMFGEIRDLVFESTSSDISRYFSERYDRITEAALHS